MSCSAKRDSNGTWHIQYRWTDWTGTKKKSQKRGFKTKKEAEEWYAHFILQQTSDPTMTLNDFWEIYKADMEKRLRKTTMKQKEYVMKDKVLPYFGNTPINAITAPMIRKWHRSSIYQAMLLSGKLKGHLFMMQEQAETQFDLLVKQMAEQEGVTEHLKEKNQMLWVQRMNNIRERAEEIVRATLLQ